MDIPILSTCSGIYIYIYIYIYMRIYIYTICYSCTLLPINYNELSILVILPEQCRVWAFLLLEYPKCSYLKHVMCVVCARGRCASWMFAYVHAYLYMHMYTGYMCSGKKLPPLIPAGGSIVPVQSCRGGGGGGQ